jgi:hypothetical protein
MFVDLGPACVGKYKRAPSESRISDSEDTRPPEAEWRYASLQPSLAPMDLTRWRHAEAEPYYAEAGRLEQL